MLYIRLKTIFEYLVFTSQITITIIAPHCKYVCALEIPRNCCIFEIPRKVVSFEIFLHWFKCTNYSLYDMIFFSKNKTGNTIYPLYLGQLWNAKRALEVHGKKNTTKSCGFLQAMYLQCTYLNCHGLTFGLHITTILNICFM